jgi:hypothetical protein
MGWLKLSIIDEKCTMMDALHPWMTSWINNELINLCVVVPTTIILETFKGYDLSKNHFESWVTWLPKIQFI